MRSLNVVSDARPATLPCPRCGWPVLWATTARGKRAPFDPDPVPTRAGFRLEPGRAGELRARFTRAPALMPLHVSHFATCLPLVRDGARARTRG